jgi:acyl-CoA synthetase (AMP-forming)/AMP-acid ligase II
MLPLFHVHGLCIGVFAMLLARATIHVHAKFDPATLVADVRERGVTVFLGVPTMYVALLEHLGRHPQDAAVLGRARLFTAGSAALAPSTLAAFEGATGHRILERYGMTETLITLSNPLHGERRAGTVGTPVAGVEARIVGDDGELAAPGGPGELQIRGDSMMLGYWRNPEATAAALVHGWFRTGDVAVRDASGTIAILGRSSTDILKSGGFKISALEVEDALREHPQVADVAVLGLPDDRWGERVVAVLEAATSIGLAELVDALAQHARSRLADYKCPRQWVVVDALRRNQMGKLEKTRLRADIEGYVGDVDARRSQT